MSESNTPIAWPFTHVTRNIEIVGSGGAFLIDAGGRRILDAAGGAIVANVGHGRASVAQAVYQATKTTTYVVPPWLTTERRRLVDRLRERWLPPRFDHIHLTCGGSEGVETAMKIAIQYHAARGEPDRNKIIGRSVSYHGTTLATTAVGGHTARKKGLAHVLEPYPSVPTPYPLRCPLGPNHPDAGRYYVDALERVIESEGADTIAAFLGEPINGSSGGAIVPPNDYWPAVRELCDRYGIVLIMDEVMTGFGRTGKRFGFQHWNIEPDVFVSGKGLAGGYAPITGVFATSAIADPIAQAGMNVMFHTFGAHPAACAAADEVLRLLDEEDLVHRAALAGEALQKRLQDALGHHPHVAEVRGRGLLQAIEIVKNRSTLEPYDVADNVTNRVVGAALKRGVFFYGGGTGDVRDIVCMGPPFIIGEAEIDLMVRVLSESLDEVLR
ncbi:MAG TPA: aminotransferase class III-fold pyridoxal phosphate-dependent enzyme [Pseudomonadales bacterium]|nr:aminotransferase class III-fold pyridoxal phosphate-dependent enzyme [Pseudomonadales bacterium]